MSKTIQTKGSFPATFRKNGRVRTIREIWKVLDDRKEQVLRTTRDFKGMLMLRSKRQETKGSTREDVSEEMSHVSKQLKNMRMMAAVAPFAAASTTNATFPLIVQALASFLKIYLLLLFLRVLLTWFPNFDWMVQPWVTLRQVTDPYLNLFRGFVPPLMGQIDFTPVVGFLLLQWLHETLESSTESLW